MKKIFLILLVFIGISCSKNEIFKFDKSERSKIDFSTFLYSQKYGLLTKASVLDVTELQTQGFSVNAYKTGTSDWTARTTYTRVMHNIGISYNGGKWEYSPILYWPNGTEKFTFFAYAPTNASVILGDPALGGPTYPQFQYSNPITSDLQKDVVLAMKENVTRGDENTPTKVKFDFDHILSKIGFTAKLTLSNTAVDITITSLTIEYTANTIKNLGIFTYGGSWDYTSTGYMSGNTDNVIISGGVELDNTTSLAVSQINADDRFLILHPQSFNEGDIKIKIGINFVNTSASVNENVVKTISLPATTLAISHQYIFNLLINPSTVVPAVEFDPNVTIGAWTDTSDVDVSVD